MKVGKIRFETVDPFTRAVKEAIDKETQSQQKKKAKKEKEATSEGVND